MSGRGVTYNFTEGLSCECVGDPKAYILVPRPSSSPFLDCWLWRSAKRVRGLTPMFSSLGLFKKTRCPDIQNCKRTTCLFSHSQDVPAEPTPLDIPIHTPKPQLQPQREQPKPTPSSSSPRNQTIPSKRAASELQTTNGITTVEPPRKISKVGTARRPGAVPTSTQTYVSSKLLDYCTMIRGNAQDVTHL